MSLRQRHFLLFLFVALGTLFWAAFGQNPPAKPVDVQTIQVKVDMVSLPVVVTTREGKRITDLQKEDFEILEDRVPQTIAGFEATDEPVTLVLALDCSGSMERKLARLQNEAIRFVNLLHPDDSVAIMSFADDVTLLTDFSIDRKRNEYGIKETRSNGSTALYEAVWLGLEDMLKPVKERKALVIFTDGVDTASRRASSKDTMDLAKESQATIYSIYFNTEDDMEMPRRTGGTVGGMPLPLPPVVVTGNPNPPGSSSSEYMMGRQYLTQLAQFSGGMLYDALKIDDLGPAFENIARELASQYSIAYYSTNTKRDGKFRSVEVKVRRPGLVARTKKGYIAPKEKR
jgi:Ca-activated chloride channel family protein